MQPRKVRTWQRTQNAVLHELTPSQEVPRDENGWGWDIAWATAVGIFFIRHSPAVHRLPSSITTRTGAPGT